MPELIAATTCEFSEQKITLLSAQDRPHKAAATTTGTGSLAAMCSGAQAAGHWSWNQAGDD